MASLNVRIAADTDDVREQINYACNATYSLYMGSAGPGFQFGAALRFLNITIPQGSTILTAKITFQAQDSRDNEDCNLKLMGIDEDNCAAFDLSGNPNALRSRPVYQDDDTYGTFKTDAMVNWYFIPAWTVNSNYDTPDISTIIQEIIDRVGWSSGNAIGIVSRDYSSIEDPPAGRTAKDYGDDDAVCPYLQITYSLPTTTTSTSTSTSTTTSTTTTATSSSTSTSTTTTATSSSTSTSTTTTATSSSTSTSTTTTGTSSSTTTSTTTTGTSSSSTSTSTSSTTTGPPFLIPILDIKSVKPILDII